MKNKLITLLVLITLGILAFGAVSASAATYGNLTYSVSGGKVTITDCNTSASGDLVIPDTIDGCPVTSIGREAFYYCRSLTRVDIPDSVTSIGNYAFRDCRSLTSVSIPDSVTSIGDWAFYECSGLTSVSIGNSVTSIGDAAFRDCRSLASISIPDGVTSIGGGAFRYCSSLTSVSIPDSVTSIDSGAFEYCSGLTRVNITDIASWYNIKFSSYDANPLYYAKNLYLNGSLVTELEIPDSVTSIGDWAFDGCSSLTSVSIPDSVTSIGREAFYGCSSLTSVSIPDSVTSIGYYTFYNCSSLTRVDITDIAAWCNIEFSDYRANPLYYAENLYLNGSLVTELEIPDSVTSIGNYAFSGCSSLASVSIPDSVTIIGESAFAYCSSLASVSIPDSVTSIGREAFYYCSSLASISIPDSVTSIGYYTFYNCSSLASISIPDSVTSIGDSAFEYCSKLTSVSIGNSVTSIGNYAFSGCSSLASVSIPDSVTSIGDRAFAGCSKIESVFYEGSKEQWNEILIESVNENLTNAKVVYNVTKKTYSFVTNCTASLPDVTDYAIYTMPIVKNAGKTLTGWYDNEKLSGEPVTFPYYGSAATLYAAWTDGTGKSFDDAIIAKENNQYAVTIAESRQIMYYEFVPKYSGVYRFYSTGGLNTYGYLYNDSKNQIIDDDDSGDGNNFYIERELTAGNTYYIGAKLYSGTGAFTLCIETDYIPGTKTVCVTAAGGQKIFITIPDYLPENARIILACYKNGELTEIQSTLNKNETIYFVTSEEFDAAKVMAWESLGNMIPLYEAETVL